MAEAQYQLPPPIETLPTSIFSWGWDDGGKLGDGIPVGTMGDRSSPTQIRMAEPKAIAGGASHGLALKADGTVWTWGENYHDQLGGVSHWSCDRTSSGDIASCPSPVRMPGFGGVKAISAGFVHNLVLKSDHTVWAWGHNSAGLNQTVTRTAQPVEVTGLIVGSFPSPSYVHPTAVAAGSAFSLVLKSDGSVWGWGVGGWGALGNGDPNFSDSAAPVQVIGPIGSKALLSATAIAAGHHHALARGFDGTVWAWGRGDAGQLGYGGNDFRRGRPVRVMVEFVNPFGKNTLQPLTDVTAIAAGSLHSLALKSDGTVWAWGDNSDGQLGDNSYNSRLTAAPVIGGWIQDLFGPRPVPMTDVVAIAAGESHSLALKADGTVWAWGSNGEPLTFRRGMLGIGNLTDISWPMPMQVVGLSDTIAIAAGLDFSLALTCSAFETDRSRCYGHMVEPRVFPRPPIVITVP